jgi:glycosyltransferase involved in cell wall biosynthesis
MSDEHDTQKVLLLLEDLAVGGAQRHSVTLAMALASDPSVEFLGFSGEQSPLFLGKGLNARSLMLRGMWRPSSWSRVNRNIDISNPHVILSVNQIASIVALGSRVLGLHSRRVVVVFHTTEIKNVAGWVRTVPFVLLSWFADRIVFVSKNQREFWLKRGMPRSKSLAIVNGIDVSLYMPPSASEKSSAKRALGFSESDFVIGSVAVFRPEKNHSQLLTALQALRLEGISAKLLLVGDGPCRGQVEKQAHQMGMKHAVLFAGMQADVRPYLSAMDVKVLSSKSVETLSIAALEAMAMAVPVVLSRIGGATEIVVEGETGMTFPSGDTDALVSCLRQVSGPGVGRRMGGQARIRAEENFNFGQMVQSYRDILKQ